MFKIGEKVVYKTTGRFSNRICISPEENETVTICGFVTAPNGIAHAFIKEYPSDKNGNQQAIAIWNLHKLDHTFAEEVTARIEEEINQENLVGA